MAGIRHGLIPFHGKGVRVALGSATVVTLLSLGIGTGSASATGPSTEVLNSVSCYKTACVVVGSTDPSGGSAIVARSSTNGLTWVVQKDPTGIETLNGVSCTSKSWCRAVGETSANDPVILASPTTGSKWTEETAPAADGDLLAIDCASATLCWAGGYSSGFVSGAVAETTDGGGVWTPESVPGGSTGVAEVTGFGCAGSGTTPIRCFATGNWSNYGQAPYLMHSTSKIKSWTDVSTLPKPGVAGTLEGAKCLTGAHCIFVGDDPAYYVLETSTSGAKFTKGTVPSGVTGLASVSCVGLKHCIAVGTLSGGGGAVLKSRTGKVWTAESAPSGTGALSSVSCSSETHCVAVGQQSAGGPAVIVTTDGGALWSSVTPPS